MSDVPPPDHVFPNILSRLPVESLLRFRCVCKSWLRTIDDPAFVKLHLYRHSESSGHLILRKRSNGKLYTLSIDSLYRSSQSLTNTVEVEAKPLETLTRNGLQVPYISNFDMNSCNGLILIQYLYDVFGKYRFMLWNPFTREAFQLPSDAYDRFLSPQIGLGYDFVSDDYKVFKIVPSVSDNDSWKILVYSLKLNSWRTIPDDYPFSLSLDNGVFVNGRLHWLKGDENEERAILAFDLTTEEYHSIPLPNSLDFSSPLNIIRLDALGECLLLTDPSDSVYRLDDYGRKNSWTKLFSFGEIGLIGGMTPIAYLKTKGEVLLLATGAILEIHYFWVNVEKKSAKEIYICEFAFQTFSSPRLFFSRMCTSSLVRLRNSCGGTDLRVVTNCTSSSNTSIVNKRLQLTLTITNVEKSKDNVPRISYLDEVINDWPPLDDDFGKLRV